MIAEGQNGLLVAPDDPDGLARACIRLLDHPDERATMGVAGWQIVNQKFSIERQVEQLKELYLEQLQHDRK